MMSDIEVNQVLLESNPITTNKLEVIRAYINKRKSVDTGKIIEPRDFRQELLMEHCYSIAKNWFLNKK